MKLMDFYLSIHLLNLPNDINRIIFSYLVSDFKLQINQFYLRTRILDFPCEGFLFTELPYYKHIKISEVYKYVSNFIEKKKINIYFTHFNYKQNGVNHIKFYSSPACMPFCRYKFREGGLRYSIDDEIEDIIQ
jgi:hypothetical protein